MRTRIIYFLNEYLIFYKKYFFYNFDMCKFKTILSSTLLDIIINKNMVSNSIIN